MLDTARWLEELVTLFLVFADPRSKFDNPSSYLSVCALILSSISSSLLRGTSFGKPTPFKTTMDLPPPAPLRCACLNCSAFITNRALYGLPPATSPFCTSGQCNCAWCEKALSSTDIIGRQIYFSRCLRKKRVYGLRRSARKPAGFYKE
jgi:hypothetical protein